MAITMHSLTPHPVRHLGGRDWLVDGLWGHRVTDIMVKPDSFPKEGQPWPILNTKWSKVPAVMSFLHFPSGDLLLPIETWKPPEVPAEQLLPFPCSFFLQHPSWPSLNRNRRHSEFSSSNSWHEAAEGRKGFLVWPDKSPIWIVSAFLPREPGFPLQACFSQKSNCED